MLFNSLDFALFLPITFLLYWWVGGRSLARRHAILASNSSPFMPPLMAAATSRPEQVRVAPSFNPPHLLPLVELVRGAETSDATIAAMHALYTSIGKSPAIVQKEAPGFVGNRLQMALYREALAIVEAGIASPQDVDTIIHTGFGRRGRAALRFGG